MLRPTWALATVLVAVALVLPSLASAAPVQCECVRYLREIMGVQIKGDAWTIKPNIPSVELKEGDVLLFDYGGKDKDHAGVILSFILKHIGGGVYIRKSIVIAETNYHKCEEGTRVVDWDDPAIKGGYRYPHTGAK